MARIRTIKPEFFTSDDICALSPLARLLYVGLWCEADRDGRLVWTPGVMKRRYLPDDACDIELLGAELTGRGLVRLYGEGLACIPSFARHQHVNIREAQSKLPPPPGETAGEFPLGKGEGKEREGEGKEDGTRAEVIAQDWKPDDGDLAWAATARPDLDGAALDAESERFANHALANRRTAHRWGPAWRIWISKAHPPGQGAPGRKPAATSAGNMPERDSEQQWRARLARYRPGKFWLEGDWGPRPESGNARVPAALLAEWRNQQSEAK